MFTTITCPQCVHKLGRIKPGNSCIFYCDKCKKEWEVTVDLNGGIHALPLSNKLKKEAR